MTTDVPAYKLEGLRIMADGKDARRYRSMTIARSTILGLLDEIERTRAELDELRRMKPVDHHSEPGVARGWNMAVDKIARTIGRPA